MLHKRYPEAARVVTEIVRSAAPSDEATARRAYLQAETHLEAAGITKESGHVFDIKEIPFLLNWGQP